ncbi:class I SAM-dependent methyltransferase [Portibacter marinus]|uniref:class I SAM-dependent methyltransferase n=1 Tax=Portibacter marinus TaxID=2898660 RepID=UPI001F33443D|nr:class I SAM-dependent methyltransferase [Portibacter marinus]
MIKEKILQAYEQLAESYDALIDHKPHNAFYDRPTSLELIGDVTGNHILDAACGSGKYAEILMEKGGIVSGFDISPKMIKLARERNRNNGKFSVHDLSEPFFHLNDHQFDIVLCALALHYIEDWNLTIQEFYRVLKPGGRLIISIEHPFFEYTYFQSQNYFNTEAVATEWSGFGAPVKMHSFRRSLQECINPIVKNGFRIIELREPKPIAEFAITDPKHYQELMTFPAFMHMKAIKNPSYS